MPRRNSCPHNFAPAVLFVFIFFSTWSFPGEAFELKALLLGESETLQKKIGFLECFISTPRASKGESKYPLLIIFHGLDENPQKVFFRSENAAAKNQTVLVVPAWISAENDRKLTPENYDEFLDELCLKFPQIDRRRIFLLGISAGSGTVRKWTFQTKNIWSGVIFAASSSGVKWMSDQAKIQRWPATLFLYGEKDTSSLKESVLTASRALKKRGVFIKILIDPNAGHEFREEWNSTVFDWMETLDSRQPERKIIPE